jgi:hypothetical protein
MNKIVYSFLTISLLIASCKQKEGSAEVLLDEKNNVIPTSGYQETARTNNKDVKGDFPELLFEEKDFDFGDINQGDKVTHVFKFKNTGKANLLIKNAAPSCGCTVPEWTKEPIKPGDNGEIKIVFNSEGKSGPQQKTINLTTNTKDGNEVLSFKTNIKVKTK